MAGAQPFAEGLGLRVEAVLGGDALAEDALDDEVQGAEVGEVVAGDGEIGCFREEFTEALDGEGVGEPSPGLVRPGPDPDVGVAALVAAAGARDQTEGGPA